MNPISLLRRENLADLTSEEDAALARELSAAYHMDETAATSRDVQRIAEKIRVRMLAIRKDDHPQEPPPVS